MTEITYPRCLFAALGQKFRSFPLLKERYRSVLYATEGRDFQVCSSRSEKCVLSQTLSSARTCTELSTQTNQFLIRMNCTTLLATTQSHHLPYLDISQTQQYYFELSKDLNTIHLYRTLPASQVDIAQLVEQLVFSPVIPGWSPATGSLFGPSRSHSR